MARWDPKTAEQIKAAEKESLAIAEETSAVEADIARYKKLQLKDASITTEQYLKQQKILRENLELETKKKEEQEKQRKESTNQVKNAKTFKKLEDDVL